MKTDILIVGTGIAGLFTSLNIPKKYRITLITSSRMRECNSYLAQGGITSVDSDDIEEFVRDTLIAGRGKNSLKTLELVAREAKDNIERLISYGADFERDSNGALRYTREAAHSKKRILYKGSETGKMIVDTLIEEVEKRDNIEVLEGVELLDIIEDNGVLYGGIVGTKDGTKQIKSSRLVLASGGIGGLFKNTTNKKEIGGIALAIGRKYNLEMSDIEHIQFHPTALKTNCNPKFLLSEALRGEGAVLRDESGKRFVDELKPRDIVANAIRDRIKQGVGVYLDARGLGEEYLKSRFTGIYKGCIERGYDISKEMVPIEPVQHYFMGGLKVDSRGRTGLEGLYVVGEAACTGLHGENRLASNSLLEGLVFAYRVAREMETKTSKNSPIKTEYSSWNYKGVARDVILEKRGDLRDELLDYR